MCWYGIQKQPKHVWIWDFSILAKGGQDGTKEDEAATDKWLVSCHNCCRTICTKHQTLDLPFPFTAWVKRVVFAFLFFLPESPSESSSLLLSCLPFAFFWELDPYTYSLAFCLALSSVSPSSVFGFQMKIDLQGPPCELWREKDLALDNNIMYLLYINRSTLSFLWLGCHLADVACSLGWLLLCQGPSPQPEASQNWYLWNQLDAEQHHCSSHLCSGQ